MDTGLLHRGRSPTKRAVAVLGCWCMSAGPRLGLAQVALVHTSLGIQSEDRWVIQPEDWWGIQPEDGWGIQSENRWGISCDDSQGLLSLVGTYKDVCLQAQVKLLQSRAEVTRWLGLVTREAWWTLASSGQVAHKEGGGHCLAAGVCRWGQDWVWRRVHWCTRL